MSKLERRYARLVHLYPARAPRDEILATVLQRSGEFSFREAFALLAGALRARAGANAHRTPAEFAHSAARLTALVLLVNAAVVDAGTTSASLDPSAVFRTPASISQYAVAGLVALILHITALAALARGAYRLAAIGAVLGLIGSAAGLSPPYGLPWYRPGFWAAPLAVLVILALNLTRRRERSAPLGWLIAVLAAVILLVGAGRVLGPGWPVGEGQVLLVLAALAVAWSFLDPRIPLAIAALSTCAALSDLIPLHSSLDTSMIANYVVNASLPLLLIATAALGRRSTRV
jgi:hypothetical protein